MRRAVTWSQLDFEAQANWVKEKVLQAYDMKLDGFHPEMVQEADRRILLNAIDRLWQEHLLALDALKEGVMLRTYGQKDPLIEFKQEAFSIFSDLIRSINAEVLHNLFKSANELIAYPQMQMAQMAQFFREHGLPMPGGAQTQPQPKQEEAPKPFDPAKEGPKLIIPTMVPQVQREPVANVGRNDPCPCGSGKKFKQCCGRTA